MNIKNTFLLFILILAALFFFPQPATAQLTILHEFTQDNGESPVGHLVSDGTRLYGVTNTGGASSLGTLFAINPDGTGFTSLRSFNGGAANPNAGLVYDGTRLYGTTNAGGPDDVGTVYAVDTDGSDFTVLHTFDNTTGANPRGALVRSGNTLYGVTIAGGANGTGVIYSIDTDGTDFTLLHQFAADYGSPWSSLTLDGTTLYGQTTSFPEAGNIFSIQTNGSGYTILYEFVSDDGYNPYGVFLKLNDRFYGLRRNGGATNNGTIFSFRPDGPDFSVHYNFDQPEGWNPTGTFIEINGVLFATTKEGGSVGEHGVIFSVNPDGSNYTVHHRFAGGASDGSAPAFYDQLYLEDDYLYGLTEFGGDGNYGTIYRMPVPDVAGPTPTPTGTPTAAPTATPAPSSGSSSNALQNNTTSPRVCSDWKPTGVPDLFQINRTGTTATLHFTPVNAKVRTYHVIFGYTENDERFGQIGAEVTEESNKGVQSITINHLDPGISYWFKVIPVNGCATGEWSNWLEAKSATKGIFYRWF
jgi:uncharacterized repeat protein (TIGR03803 family)